MGNVQPIGFRAKGRRAHLRWVLPVLGMCALCGFHLAGPGAVRAQYGGLMGGFSQSPEQLGGAGHDTGWDAEIKSKHKEFMEEERQRDQDFKKTFEDANTGDEPGPREETVKAQAFISQFDLGIPPELVKEVKNDPKKALERYTSLLGSAKKSRDAHQERQGTVTLGHIYYLLGLFGEASAKYSDALKLYRAAGDRHGEAQMLGNLGATSAASGSYEDALESYEAALNTYKETRDAEGERRIRTNLAVLAQNRGQTEVAIKQFQEALDPSAATDELKIINLENLGRIYSQAGEYTQAIDCFTDSLALIRKLGDATREGTSLMVLAEIYGSSGDRDKSLACLLQARELFSKGGEVPRRVSHLIGSALLDSGRIAEAEPYIKESGYRSDTARLSLMKSEFDTARKLYDELLRVAKQYGRSQDTFIAYAGLGRVHESLGDLRNADKYYSLASDASEQLRASLLLSERKDFYSKPINGFVPIEPVRGLVRVRMKMKRAAESLVLSEQIRARNFADHMARRLRVSSASAPKAVLEQEELRFDKLASLLKARDLFSRQQDPRRFDQLTRSIDKAERELKAFMETLRKNFPAYYALRSGRPLTLSESGIRDHEYVLVLDALGDGVGVKLIKGKRLIYSAYEEGPESDLEKEVTQLLGSMSPQKLEKFPAKTAFRLQEQLCAHALSKVPSGTPVIIVPDSLLATVPFEALVMSKPEDASGTKDGPAIEKLQFLGDVYPVSYYQSITALTLTRKRAKATPAANRLLVIADPIFSPDDERLHAHASGEPEDSSKTITVKLMEITKKTGLSFPRLAFTGRLAGAMDTMFPGITDTLTGTGATKQRLFSLPLHSYAYLVCATHGYYGNDIPGIMEPVLALSLVPSAEDGLLTMSEVMGLDLNAELAALIACQTGLGQSLPGEGVMSMGRAFQYAGARSVLMSLWSVAEKPSVKLVESFFAHRNEGKTKREALRLGRKDLKQQGYDHPFFWASFILVGEAD
jgi:CHAT domain-containing protein